MGCFKDPWSDIGVPSPGEGFRVRRIDPNCPWNFYRARDSYGRYALVMRFEGDPPADVNIPRLREISIVLEGGGDEKRGWFILALETRENVELFDRLCTDVVDSTKLVESEETALRVAINRTWRWHRLMRGGVSGILSREAQQGLVGELLFVRDILMNVLPPADALRAWEGPSGAPHDVAAGYAEVEIKTRRINARQEIRVSSEDQLEKARGSSLYLWVADIGESAQAGDGHASLRDLVASVRSIARETSDNAEDLLDQRLEDSGYVDREEYERPVWFSPQQRCYEVNEEFPRLVPNMLPNGIEHLTYSLDLDCCEDFQISIATLTSTLQGMSNG